MKESDLTNIPWLELRGIEEHGLSIEHFSVKSGEQWCIWGENRSGVDELVALLAGKCKGSAPACCSIPENLATVSFERQQKLYEQEVRDDNSNVLKKVDPGTLARSFLGSGHEGVELVRLLRLEHVLDNGYRQLSSGESRKLLILQAITNGSRHLVIQNPYDGLDNASRHEFDRIVENLSAEGLGIIVTMSSRAEIPSWCSHLAWMENGRLAGQGLKEEVLSTLSAGDSGTGWSDDELEPFGKEAEDERPLLVSLENGRARYGERLIFSGLDLEVRKGDHTLITGTNGTGKSTLLSIISGDHPDCYTNKLSLFGIPRGSGESIWDLKKNMGVVSPELHRNHFVPGNTLQIVISGFFDSIGLYRKFSKAQEAQASAWLRRLNLEDLEKVPFRRLHFGEQRLVLIARALIKMPELLLLDEPTQGLDDSHRAHLLNFLEYVADRNLSTIIYVSHRQDEYRGFFNQHVDLSHYSSQTSRSVA